MTRSSFFSDRTNRDQRHHGLQLLGDWRHDLLEVGTVSFTGPSGITTSFSAAVIAGVVTMTGSGNVTLNFDSSSNAPLLSGNTSITLTS